MEKEWRRIALNNQEQIVNFMRPSKTPGLMWNPQFRTPKRSTDPGRETKEKEGKGSHKEKGRREKEENAKRRTRKRGLRARRQATEQTKKQGRRGKERGQEREKHNREGRARERQEKEKEKEKRTTGPEHGNAGNEQKRGKKRWVRRECFF